MKITKAKVKDYQYAYYNGKQYELVDAFEKGTSGDIVKADYVNNATYPYKADVILVDMGEDAGRLRLGVFARRTSSRLN